MAKKYTGQCACGAVTFAFDTAPGFIADCYCKDCQRASGGCDGNVSWRACGGLLVAQR